MSNINDTKKRTAIMIRARSQNVIDILEKLYIEADKFAKGLSEFDADTLDRHWRVEYSEAKCWLFNVNELCYLLVENDLK